MHYTHTYVFGFDCFLGLVYSCLAVGVWEVWLCIMFNMDSMLSSVVMSVGACWQLNFRVGLFILQFMVFCFFCLGSEWLKEEKPKHDSTTKNRRRH
jgi:hypothetical protein